MLDFAIKSHSIRVYGNFKYCGKNVSAVEILMGLIGEKFAGLEALCKHYVELGVDASVLPEGSPEALEKGLVRKDMGYIKVKGRNFELVTIRMKGTTSGSYS